MEFEHDMKTFIGVPYLSVIQLLLFVSYTENTFLGSYWCFIITKRTLWDVRKTDPSKKTV